MKNALAVPDIGAGRDFTARNGRTVRSSEVPNSVPFGEQRGHDAYAGYSGTILMVTTLHIAHLLSSMIRPNLHC